MTDQFNPNEWEVRQALEKLQTYRNALVEIQEDRDRAWKTRWKVRERFKAQKRRIKHLLKKMGVKIKGGTELSKLLRLDTTP